MNEINEQKDKYFLKIKEIADNILNISIEDEDTEESIKKLLSYWIKKTISIYRDSKLVSESRIDELMLILDSHLNQDFFNSRSEKEQNIWKKEAIYEMIKHEARQDFSW